jgi:hypothetical protein
MKNIIILNSIAGNVNILLSNGHYKPMKKLTTNDILINQHGNRTKIKNIIFKGQDKIINLHNEAWNDITKISKDQRFINNNSNIILPSRIDWDIPRGSKSKSLNYSFGYSISLLLYGSFIVDDKIIIFMRKEHLNEINYNLATTFGIHNIECYEGKFLIKYVFLKDNVPRYIYDSIQNKNIDESIYKYDDDYLRGLFNGFNSALNHSEKITDKSSFDFLSNFCNWLNIAVPKDDNKLCIRYFIEDKEESEDLWDIETNDIITSFIGNNLVFLF